MSDTKKEGLSLIDRLAEKVPMASILQDNPPVHERLKALLKAIEQSDDKAALKIVHGGFKAIKLKYEDGYHEYQRKQLAQIIEALCETRNTTIIKAMLRWDTAIDAMNQTFHQDEPFGRLQFREALFYCATRRGDVDLMRTIFEALPGINPLDSGRVCIYNGTSCTDADEHYALFAAVKNQDEAALQYLTDVVAKAPYYHLESSKKRGLFFMLGEAERLGREDVVDFLARQPDPELQRRARDAKSRLHAAHGATSDVILSELQTAPDDSQAMDSRAKAELLHTVIYRDPHEPGTESIVEALLTQGGFSQEILDKALVHAARENPGIVGTLLAHAAFGDAALGQVLRLAGERCDQALACEAVKAGAPEDAIRQVVATMLKRVQPNLEFINAIAPGTVTLDLEISSAPEDRLERFKKKNPLSRGRDDREDEISR